MKDYTAKDIVEATKSKASLSGELDKDALDGASQEFAKKSLDEIMELVNERRDNYDRPFFVYTTSKFDVSIKGHGFIDEHQTSLRWPRPTYKQILYKFNPKTDVLEFIHAIPSRLTCVVMYANRYNPEMVKNPLMLYAVEKESNEIAKRANDYNLKLGKELHGKY